MTQTTIPGARVDVRVDSNDLLAQAERGDKDSIYTLARSAVATGVANDAIRERLDGVEEGFGDGLWEAIKNFFTGTHVEERGRTRQHWQWPLFALGCPAVEGAETAVSVETERQVEAGWTLKLFGSGFEQKTTLAVSDSIAGTASPGQHRILYAGHDVDVVHFDLVRGGNVVSQGTRIELAAGSGGVVGWIDLPAGPQWLSLGPLIQKLGYRSAGPKSEQTWSREESLVRNFELVLGPDLKPVELGSTVSYELTTKVSLEATLPGGSDWYVVRPQQCEGMTVIAAT